VIAPYPWLDTPWRELQEKWVSDTLGHAYLISGPSGLGKQKMSESLAATILCEAAELADRPCRRCRGCALFESNNHPDLKRLNPENGSKNIAVEQVRELTEFYRLKSHYLGYKIGLVHPADLMNAAAANAILKTLEEPPPLALLILVSDRPGLLPQTVTSRCHNINVQIPSWGQTEKWLAAELRGRKEWAVFEELTLIGAPLDVLRQIETEAGTLLNDVIDALDAVAAKRNDAYDTASSFNSVEILSFIEALEAIIQSLVFLDVGHRVTRLKLPENRFQQLERISKNLNVKCLFYFLDEIRDVRSLLLRSNQLRRNEIIESLWCGWQKIILATERGDASRSFNAVSRGGKILSPQTT